MVLKIPGEIFQIGQGKVIVESCAVCKTPFLFEAGDFLEGVSFFCLVFYFSPVFFWLAPTHLMA